MPAIDEHFYHRYDRHHHLPNLPNLLLFTKVTFLRSHLYKVMFLLPDPTSFKTRWFCSQSAPKRLSFPPRSYFYQYTPKVLFHFSTNPTAWKSTPWSFLQITTKMFYLLNTVIFQSYRNKLTFKHGDISTSYHQNNKGGKFLKKLWCCVGGEYHKIIWFYQLSW